MHTVAGKVTSSRDQKGGREGGGGGGGGGGTGDGPIRGQVSGK